MMVACERQRGDNRGSHTVLAGGKDARCGVYLLLEILNGEIIAVERNVDRGDALGMTKTNGGHVGMMQRYNLIYYNCK